MNLYTLAEQLHRPVSVLMTELTPEEFAHWIAMSRIRHEEMEEEKRKAQFAAKAGR